MVLKVHIVHRQIKHTISKHEHKTQQVPKSTIIWGWLGDGSHRGQGCQAWTAVGLPPRYPLQEYQLGTLSTYMGADCWQQFQHGLWIEYWIKQILATKWPLLLQ